MKEQGRGQLKNMFGKVLKFTFIFQRVTRSTLKTGTSTSRRSSLSRSSSVERMLSRTKTPLVWSRRTLAKK